MKLLEQRRAPNPRRVRMFLAEKGIEVASEPVDLMAGEHRSAEMVRLNPYQQLPVLILDDGTAISETMAICRYFELLRPEPALFGVGALGQATVEMWNRRMEHGLLSAVAQTVRHTHPAFAALEHPQVKEWGEANRGRVGEHLARLDRELAGRPWIAGDAFSVADITALAAIDFMKLAKIERSPALTSLDRWYHAISARPSAKAGM